MNKIKGKIVIEINKIMKNGAIKPNSTLISFLNISLFGTIFIGFFIIFLYDILLFFNIFLFESVNAFLVFISVDFILFLIISVISSRLNKKYSLITVKFTEYLNLDLKRIFEITETWLKKNKVKKVEREYPTLIKCEHGTLWVLTKSQKYRKKIEISINSINDNIYNSRIDISATPVGTIGIGTKKHRKKLEKKWFEGFFSQLFQLLKENSPPKQRFDVDKLKKLIKVSEKLTFDQMALMLKIDKKVLYDNIIDWAVEYGFTIDQELINFSNARMDEFIDNLDSMFSDWKEKEKSAEGKKAG